MAYDLLIKNGRIIDGSGRPAFNGDVAVARGRIVELGRLDGAARRVIEADGRVVAPGFVDNHCHYDAQVALGPALHLLVPPRRDHRDHRQLLAGARPGQGARAPEAGRHAVVRRGHPDGRAGGGRALDVGDVPRVHGRDRPAARASTWGRSSATPPSASTRWASSARIARPRTPSSRPCGACCARPSMRARSGSRSPAT